MSANAHAVYRVPLLAVSLTLCACASQSPIVTDGLFKPDGSYVLSQREQRLSCQKLAGTLQIKLAVLKDYRQRARPSLLAQAGQSFGNSVMGHSRYPGQPEAEHRQQLARAVALNEQLKAKGCQPYDIDAELARKADP